MRRYIKTLFNFEPPATDEETRAASLQFVREVSGFSRLSQANQVALHRAVDEVASAARLLLFSLVMNAEPCDRAIEAAKARPRSIPSSLWRSAVRHLEASKTCGTGTDA